MRTPSWHIDGEAEGGKVKGTASRCRYRIEIFEESNLLWWLKCQEAHAKPFLR